MDEYQKDEKINPEQPETEPDDELTALGEFFDGLEPNMTLVISRLEPSEFKGVLEEIDIEPGQNPVSLNYLIKKWGGHKLLLRLRRPRGGAGAGQWAAHRTISLYSYPPLRFGERLTRTDMLNGEAFRERPKEATEKNPMNSMLEMANLMSQMRQGEIAAMTAMMGQLAPQQQPQPAIDPMAQATQLLALMQKFQSMQAPQQPIAQTGDDQVIGLLGKLAESFAATNKPIGPPPMLSGPTEQNPTQPTPQSVVADLRKGFLGLDPNGQQQVLGDIFGQLQAAGGDELLLSTLEKMGIIDPDDDTIENDAPENPRGEPGSNEGDNTPDR
jgi:hypothetical protein